MSAYTKHLNTRSTPQNQPIPGRKGMVANDGGGYSFKLDSFARLERFLILGSEGGHFQVGEAKLTVDNANCVFECARADTNRTLGMIVEISDEGRAPKNDPAIFALAILSSMKEKSVSPLVGVDCSETISQKALKALPRVCRIFTHLADFIGTLKKLRGFGPSVKKAIQRWYNNMPVEKLAMQVTKYQNRNGFTQRDVLRLAKPKTAEHDRNLVYAWAVGKVDGSFGVARTDSVIYPSANIIYGFEAAKRAATDREITDLIHRFGLVREHIPTEFLNSPRVWAALLQNMPATALIRNLGKMSAIGLLTPLSAAANQVVAKLTDREVLKQARVHPFGLLLAQTTYAAGKGVKGDLTWKPVPQVTDALQDAFYDSFNYVQPTNKRHYLAIDVSGSMGFDSSRINNTHIKAREAAACMAMVTLRTERQSYSMAFSHKLIDLGLTKSMRLDDVVRKCEATEMGSTDCSAPMRDARERNIPVDVFVVYTDSDTNCSSREHPIQSLDRYRQATGIPAKLAVVAMCSNGHTIADPNDPNTLDIAGFDADCPALLAEFARGGASERAGKAA